MLYKMVGYFESGKEKGQVLYSKELNSLIMIVRDYSNGYSNGKVVDCKSLNIEEYKHNPTKEEINDIAIEFVKIRHEVELELDYEWKRNNL
jgi:hypothetical protein